MTAPDRITGLERATLADGLARFAMADDPAERRAAAQAAVALQALRLEHRAARLGAADPRAARHRLAAERLRTLIGPASEGAGPCAS